MTETMKPDPTEPADSGDDDAPKPRSDESFLQPGDADAADGQSGGAGGSPEPKPPRPPD